ncbi:MAG: hypothetical protein AB7U73_07140 [Pirellulales bacterium]
MTTALTPALALCQPDMQHGPHPGQGLLVFGWLAAVLVLLARRLLLQMSS